jgi:lambda repressor-like predicted transcriptional regulator
MALLEARLRELAAKRDELRTLGTSEQLLHRAVDLAERTLTRTLMNYEAAVSEEILAERYGQPVPLMKLDRRERDSLKLHKRVSDLRKFSVNSGSETDVSVKALLRRADRAGERLVALREHIAKDQSEHNVEK